MSYLDSDLVTHIVSHSGDTWGPPGWGIRSAGRGRAWSPRFLVPSSLGREPNKSSFALPRHA